MADDEISPVREGAPDPPRGRRLVRRFLELLVLSSFAIGQPLLDVSGRSPETFVFHRVDGIEVVAYALLVLLVPPVVLWLGVTTLGLLAARVGQIAHVIVAGGLIALTMLQAGKNLTPLRGPVLVMTAAVVAVAILWLVIRTTAAQTFVTYLFPAPLVFAFLFVLTSPSGALVRPAEAAAAGVTRAAGPTPPVVMLILDELPLVSLLGSNGRVDERVFPNFAALSDTSHWFRNGTGVGPFTAYAVPSMLTGRYPEQKLVPSHAQHPDNLFSLLAADYRIRAFETITQLCDPALCTQTQAGGGGEGLGGLLGQTWEMATKLATPYEDDEPVSEQFAEQAAGPVRQPTTPGATITEPNWATLKANQPARFQQFLAGLRPHRLPTVHFLHLLLPHHPWRYLPSGATHPDKLLGGVKGGWGSQTWPAQVNRQAHLLQLAYTDRLLGVVINRLKKQGLWDDALVVVTSDHGESFVPGGSNRRISKSRPESQAQVAWVPVFLKEPGQSQGTVSDDNWEQVDLLPTMAEILDRQLPFPVDGIAHLSADRQRSTKYFYNYPGRRIEFPAEPAFSIVRRGVTDTFTRASHGVAGLYEIGRHPNWIGQPVSSLRALGVDVGGPPSRIRARLADEVDFAAVDPASGTAPSLVTGTLRGTRGRGHVVVAVNGTVGAISEIYPEAGKPSFAGLVNEELVGPGENDLALYEVVGDTDPELRPIAIASR